MTDPAQPLDALTALMALLPPIQPEPGVVYRHLDQNGTVLYVGSTSQRQMRSRHVHHIRSARWWGYVATVTAESHPDRRAAFHAERAAIAVDLPIFNRSVDGEERSAKEAAYVQRAGAAPVWRPLPRALGPRVRRGLIDAELARVMPPSQGAADSAAA